MRTRGPGRLPRIPERPAPPVRTLYQPATAGAVRSRLGHLADRHAGRQAARLGGGPEMNAKRRMIWTFVVTSAALFMASLDNLVVTTALPSIRAHLHASLAGLEWTVNAYTLTFAVLLLTGATLGERYGRRRLFIVGLGLF